MKKCKIDKALESLNQKRGLSYPDIGYMYYANIAGDGRNYRSVYQVINSTGGVCKILDGSPVKILKRINDCIADIK